MDTNKIIAELRTQRDRIDKAIAAIESLGSGTLAAKQGRRAQSMPSAPRPRRRLSPAARKRLSALLKARWASGKMGKAKKKA